MKSTTLDNLVRASAGALDYGSIDATSLIDLALQESDAEVATSALGELSPHDARDTALEILRRPVWDSHLTAFALTLLYVRDPEAAFEMMKKFGYTANEKPIIEALIENILSDQERFQTGEGRRFAGELASRIATEQVALDPDDLSQFNALYGTR
jgi:hypothetical protein